MKSLRTVRGRVGGSGREYNLVRQICIVSSSGTLVNKEHTSKEHIVSLLCLCDFAQSTKVNSLRTVRGRYVPCLPMSH